MLESHGFKPLGFRYYKDIYIDTGKELTPEQSKKTPTHDIFQIYVDPIVNEIHPSFRELFGFTPIDEPLLSLVFQDKNNRVELTEFNKLLWLPTPEILLTTKIKSTQNRTKDEKLIKDICDIYTLSWYSGKNIDHMKNEIHKLLQDINQILLSLQSDKLLQKAETAMGINAATIKNVLKQLQK